jgi:O-antigen/teichoic acid export membrane protein
MIPNAFGHPLGATMMAQYGRGEERLHQLTVSGAKYAFLLALPLLAGMACISGPAILLLYGHAYQPMIPVLTIAAVLAIPKSLIGPATLLLQSYENQGYLIAVGCACGALDILLDILLTPSHGAVGAALANGLAQTAAAIAIWYRVRRAFRLNLRMGGFGRIALSGMVMAAAVLLVQNLVAGYAGLVVAVVSGAVVWMAMLRLTGAIDREDGERFVHIGRILPERVRPIYDQFVSLVAAG